MPIVYPRKTAMPCRDPEERRRSWDEVAEGYTVERAIAEARRCLSCQDPVCEQGCPVNVPIRDFVRHVALGDFAGAAASIRRRNLLPAICGRVCPVEHQCELRCVLNPHQDPVGIGRLERFVADWEREHGTGGETAAPEVWRDQKIGIVGSGPAGLTVASDLAQLGYPVTIFEALHAFGGVLRYGIPQYRLPKEIVDEDVEHLKALGVEFVKDVIIGKTVTIDQLIDELGYSAVFVGTGAGSPVFMNIPGENLKGIYSANEFLTRVNLMHAYSFPEYDTPIRQPRRAAVIGAGDTAMDAVRCSIRLGAEEAHIVYRRSEKEKGARAEDYERARDEGVIFDWLTLPKRFLGDEKGWVRGIECIRTELGEPDDSGRRRPVPVPGSEFTMEADVVVIALGTNPNPLVPRTTYGLEVDRHGCIVADPQTGATSREGVFAGGDIVTGAATVILAMGAGRKAAVAIHEYLQQRGRVGSVENRALAKDVTFMDMSTQYLGLSLRSPLVASAGPLTSTIDGIRRLESAGVGAVVLPSLYEEQQRDEVERDFRLEGALADSNFEALSYLPPDEEDGRGRYLSLISRAAKTTGIPVIASLNGVSPGGWTDYASAIEQAGASAIELNICYMHGDPLALARDAERRYIEVLTTVKAVVSIPVAVKLSPYFSSIGEVAVALDHAGADGLALFSRYLQTDIDPETFTVSTGFGLSASAEAALPRAWISRLRGLVRCSLAATTGVETAVDVAACLLAGADVVMSTSALMRHGPDHARVLLDGLQAWMDRKGFTSVTQTRGLLAKSAADGPASGRPGYLSAIEQVTHGHYHSKVG